MTAISVESISVFGQGLPGWEKTAEILRDFSKYDAGITPTIESRFLSPNNKRRTSPHMHAAIQAAEYALMGTNVDEKGINLIFAASECDLDIADDNLMALTHQEKELSPQKFQNVILNAAAGHLGIFMKNVSGSTTVSGMGNTFAVGLLQAHTSLEIDTDQVLLVAYDAPSMMPYGPGNRPFFAVGMVLSKERSKNSLAALTPKMVTRTKTDRIGHEAFEQLEKTTPAATCLPLLIALARKNSGPVELYYSDRLCLQVSLCF